jgi:Flp pilus assembly protein TadG
MKTRFREHLADQSGSVALITGIAIFALLGAAALALDIGHMVMVKSQLQKAADAGALAGARGLWPLTLPVTDPTIPRTPDCAAGLLAAQLTAHNNKVDGSNLALDSEITVQVGRWDYAARNFTPGCTSNSNCVRVNTRRTGVVMLFARIFGMDTADATGAASAVMDFAGGVGKGGLPICLDRDYTDPGTPISVKMTPDNTDNAGWFIVPPDAAAASMLKNYINKGECPPLYIGQTINLQNGADASVLSALQDGLAQHPDGWNTILPVVTTPKFGQDQPIVGFVPVCITAVVSTGGHKRVEGHVLDMGELGSALPGGPNFGALAPPKGVQ